MDVVVVGGGSAGVAAAVSAARAGARTLLVERSDLLGGMPSLALVHTICGLYDLADPAAFANPGFASEFASRLIGRGGAGNPVQMGRVRVLPIDPAEFARLASDLVSEESRLEVWTNAAVTGVSLRGNRVDAIEVEQRGVCRSVACRTLIDCTGDAIVAKIGGMAAEMVEGRRLQRPAFIVGLRNVPERALEPDARLRIAHAIAAAVSTGDLPGAALGAAFRTSIRPDEAFLTIDLGAGDGAWNPDDPDLVRAVEIEGRETARCAVDFLRRKVAGWADAEIFLEPRQAGIRESRRACGAAVLTGARLLAGETFADGVVRVAWPIELRETATGPKWKHPSARASIPLRALRHHDVENLWFAGRCISCDHEAQASIRVIGTCLATGEAAGIAAAVSEERDDWPERARRVARIRDEISGG